MTVTSSNASRAGTNIALLIVVSLDVAGRERTTIIFDMTVTLWDVLSVVTYAMLRFYIGPEHAWPVVTVLCAVCYADRDIDINELLSAAYMLRFACHTELIERAPAYFACLVAGSVCLAAHTRAYASLGHVYRRSCLFGVALLSIMVRYPWNTYATTSVFRLIVFTVATRYLVTAKDKDPWDSSLQCMWVLALPMQAYVILLYPVGVYVNGLRLRTRLAYRPGDLV